MFPKSSSEKEREAEREERRVRPGPLHDQRLAQCHRGAVREEENYFLPEKQVRKAVVGAVPQPDCNCFILKDGIPQLATNKWNSWCQNVK